LVTRLAFYASSPLCHLQIWSKKDQSGLLTCHRPSPDAPVDQRASDDSSPIRSVAHWIVHPSQWMSSQVSQVRGRDHSNSRRTTREGGVRTATATAYTTRHAAAPPHPVTLSLRWPAASVYLCLRCGSLPSRTRTRRSPRKQCTTSAAFLSFRSEAVWRFVTS
jgi:hypothetical protein